MNRNRWLGLAFGLTALAGTVIAVLTVVYGGTGWDTPFEIQLAAGVLHALPAGGLQAAYDSTPYLFEFYGTLNTAIVERLAGLFTPGVTLDPQDTAIYVWLGLWNTLIGIAGVGGLAYAVARALRSTLAGWLLAALIMTTPLWLGHLAMNPKDVPTAVGLSLVTAGLVVAWLPDPRRFDWAVSLVLIAVGTAELIGSRASGTILIGALVVGSWVLSLFRRRVVATSFFGVLIGLGVVWLQSPFARRGMVRWLADAATTSNINPSQVRFAGQDISTGALPLTYIPGWFLAQLPLLTTLLLGLGAAVVVAVLIGRVPGVQRSVLYPLTPVALQGLALPGMVALSHAIIYDAARHVLFALPALLVLGVFPLMWVIRWNPAPRRWLLWGGIGLTCLALFAGLFAAVRWYPYEYAFINPIAGHNHQVRDWELDYWGASSREGVARLNELGATRVAELPSNDPGEPWGALTIDDVASDTAPYGVYVFNRWDAQLPGNCTPAFSIVRDGHELGVGGLCTP